MITKHKYEVAKFGNAVGANKKPVTSTVEVAVSYPDTLAAFGDEQRIIKILSGFISAHHVQSRLKGAYMAEPGKRTAEQLALIKLIEDKQELEGVTFIPDERSAKRKDDKTVEALKAGWEKLDAFRKGKLMERWGMESGETLEDFIAGYWAWVDAEKAKREKENLDSLGLGE